MAISVQKGEAVLSSDSDTITITEVDLDRSFVIIDSSTDTTTGSSGYQSWGVHGKLTDSTTLTIQRDGGVADAQVTWTVVTCDQSEFLVVDRGTTTISTGSTTGTSDVAESDPTRTMLIYGSRGNFATGSTNLGFATLEYTTPTLLTGTRGGTSSTRTYVFWEAIEWSLESGVTVEKGTASVTVGANNELSFSHGVTGVTTTNTWCFSQARHSSNGLEQCSMRVRFDSTDILLKRYDQTNAYVSDIAWQLVTFPEDCCEQRTPVMANTDNVKDTTPSLVMDTGATIVWFTNSCNGTGQAFGRNAWNTQVLNSTTIRSKRSYTGQAGEGALSICDFSLINNVANTTFIGHL